MFYHMASWRLVDNQKPTRSWTIFGVFFRLIFSPLLSWLAVGYYIYLLIKDYIEKNNMPEKLKEIQFRLKTVDYKQEEVIELLREIAKFQGTEEAFNYWLMNNLQSSNGEDYDTLVLDDDEYGYYSEIMLRWEWRYRYYFRSPDYDTVRTNIFEYKVCEDFTIDIRTIEAKIEHPWDEYYEIENWVICKSTLKRRKKGKESMSLKSVEELTRELSEQIKWGKLNYKKIRYFLLDRSTKFPQEVLNTFLRQESETLKELIVDIETYCEKNKAEFLFDEDIAEFVIEGLNSKNELKIRKGIDKITQKLWIDWSEYPYLQDMIDRVEKYIKI